MRVSMFYMSTPVAEDYNTTKIPDLHYSLSTPHPSLHVENICWITRCIYSAKENDDLPHYHIKAGSKSEWC